MYRIPMANVYLDGGAGAQNAKVGLIRNLPTDVLLGNILGTLISSFHAADSETTCPVTTHAQAWANVTVPPPLKLRLDLVATTLSQPSP